MERAKVQEQMAEIAENVVRHDDVVQHDFARVANRDSVTERWIDAAIPRPGRGVAECAAFATGKFAGDFFERLESALRQVKVQLSPPETLDRRSRTIGG